MSTLVRTQQLETRMNLAVLMENRWDNNKRTLESWLEQLEAQLDLLDITEGPKKTKALIAAVSGEAYETLKNLSTPEKPTDKSFADLKKLLLAYARPKPIELVERYNFAQISQRKDEDVTEYLGRVRRGAEHCEFKNFYADAVRDKFVGGLADKSIQRVLLAEDGLTVDAAYKKAVAREQAGLNTAVFHPRESSVLREQVDKVSVGGYKNHGKFKTQSKQGSSASYSDKRNTKFKCDRCKLNRSKCTRDKCVTKCFKCRCDGHCTMTCFSKSKTSNVNELDEFD